MKHTLSMTIVLAAALFTSCKKDYTCTCTNSGTVVSTATIHATKSDATSQCNALSSSGNNGKTCAIQ